MIWYDECFLRYSNRNIFSAMDTDFTLFMTNPNNITANIEYNELVVRTITGAAKEAASAPSGAKKFAVKKVIDTWREDLYVLVECTPDLSTSDCKQCLQAANSKLLNCCDNRLGGRVLFPSCHFGFGTYLFYNEAAVALPPTPVVLPPPFPGPRSEGKVVALILSGEGRISEKRKEEIAKAINYLTWQEEEQLGITIQTAIFKER
ncbi:unnamed protein product [Dovyalis caffra]|uniref:Gnk2-homologous domain-containing protein n=1 Tax=Dovyalis caffra TaxID=77055 RepID=A0AAV1SKV9_9ROSI|nr:unnamed protein product [Dovyalis caffra]